MSHDTCPTFRGYRAITEVIERLQPLADWYASYRPTTRIITLRRRDLDLLQRWPKAAALHEVYTTDGRTYWRGHLLQGDSSPTRYPRNERR